MTRPDARRKLENIRLEPTPRRVCSPTPYTLKDIPTITYKKYNLKRNFGGLEVPGRILSQHLGRSAGRKKCPRRFGAQKTRLHGTPRNMTARKTQGPKELFQAKCPSPRLKLRTQTYKATTAIFGQGLALQATPQDLGMTGQ